MKIAINTENNELLNIFIKFSKESGYEIILAKAERVLFEQIENGGIDAYILSKDSLYFNKATDFIKKSNPYVPIVGLITAPALNYTPSTDILMQISLPYENLVSMILINIQKYIKNFQTLQKLTAKMHEKIEFANCVYDPTRRILYHKGKEIKKLSAKEGGILEILAINYGEVVKKEVILEKVWRKPNDYFAGRSCDVYITYLRNTLKNNKIKLSIKNISGIGLILE